MPSRGDSTNKHNNIPVIARLKKTITSLAPETVNFIKISVVLIYFFRIGNLL
jgi:hypothetical protein